MLIEDGGGSGQKMQITSEGRAKVISVSASTEHNVNHEHGKAYQAEFACDPDGAGDCFFYLKNTDDTDIVVEGVWLSLAGADEIQCKIGDTGTAVKTKGADITPVNMNAGSGNEADCLCYSNTADGAVDITGLSGGLTFQTIWVTAAASSNYFNFECDVIVPKNQAITLYAVGGDAAIRGTVVFDFHDKDLG